MRPYTVFLCFGVVIFSANARTVLPIEDVDGTGGDIRILVLVDNDDKLHFLNQKPPKIKDVYVDDTEVIFYYKSRYTPLTEFLVFNVDYIIETDFDPSRRTMFIIHGWNSNLEAAVNTEISEALLRADDWNVFIVDWGEKANSLYRIALGSVPGVGDITAKFIRILQHKTGIPMSNINLCGHSLGAHVCGRVGSVLNGAVNSILAMDPALPFIDQDNIDKRLDPSDAQYVEVIHTNGGLLGFLKPIGHSDFYPNGGMTQKGCGLDPFGKCAHSRAHLLFAESIINNNFKARYCKSNSDWKNGYCNNNEVAYMGGNNLDRICGTYYLDTAEEEPFSLG